MDLRERLREQGLRLTPQRELVLAAVEKLQHATPDEIYAEVQSSSAAVNRSTVYRTLEVLEELGLVRHLHLSDRAPTYHAVEAHPHFHLKCRKCGRRSLLHRRRRRRSWSGCARTRASRWTWRT